MTKVAHRHTRVCVAKIPWIMPRCIRATLANVNGGLGVGANFL